MKNRQSCDIRGLTLIELLIVVLIISLLIQMMLPAIEHAREAARRTQCQNNMRQLGLAMQQYEAEHRLLPPGWVREENLDHNYVQFLLPYIDQSAIFDQYDFTVSWKDPKNKPLTKVEIPLLRCLSSTRKHRYRSDYAMYIQVEPEHNQALIDEGVLQPRENTDGALRGKAISSAQIVDGRSKTIFLCEDSGRPEKYWFGRRLVKGKCHGSLWATPTSRFAIDVRCNGTKFRVGRQLMNCTNNNEIFSFHPTGANFLFGDGSVRYVLEDVEPDVLISMLTAHAED